MKFCTGIKKTKIVQVVVPKAVRSQILKQLHDGAFGGHLGEANTLSRLCKRIYWTGYSEDAVEWYKTCPICAARKQSPPSERGSWVSLVDDCS